MKLDFDPERLRISMRMWRDATDLKVPVHDNFKIHFIESRASLLEGFVKIGNAFSTILRACTAEGQDLVELDAINADVEEFKQWAKDGLEELSSLASEESRKDSGQ